MTPGMLEAAAVSEDASRASYDGRPDHSRMDHSRQRRSCT